MVIGDVLVHENIRLQKRTSQLHYRIEAELRQCLRLSWHKRAELEGLLANLMLCFEVGRWHQLRKVG